MMTENETIPVCLEQAYLLMHNPCSSTTTTTSTANLYFGCLISLLPRKEVLSTRPDRKWFLQMLLFGFRIPV